jgi:hypothetical protein
LAARIESETMKHFILTTAAVTALTALSNPIYAKGGLSSHGGGGFGHIFSGGHSFGGNHSFLNGGGHAWGGHPWGGGRHGGWNGFQAFLNGFNRTYYDEGTYYSLPVMNVRQPVPGPYVGPSPYYQYQSYQPNVVYQAYIPPEVAAQYAMPRSYAP